MRRLFWTKAYSYMAFRRCLMRQSRQVTMVRNESDRRRSSDDGCYFHSVNAYTMAENLSRYKCSEAETLCLSMEKCCLTDPFRDPRGWNPLRRPPTGSWLSSDSRHDGLIRHVSSSSTHPLRQYALTPLTSDRSRTMVRRP